MHGPVHSIVVCTRCLADARGLDLMDTLRSLLHGGLEEAFTVSGVRCMAGCERPLAVGFSAPGKASYLFGDVDPQRDAEHLVSFARLYRALDDGWCNEGQRPLGLAGKIVARIPAPTGKSP
jgi:predicted metal-binding protein